MQLQLGLLSKDDEATAGASKLRASQDAAADRDDFGNWLDPEPDESPGNSYDLFGGVGSSGYGDRSASPSSVVPSEVRTEAPPPRHSGLVGLGNLGNTCFMASMMQCLASIRELRLYFTSGAYRAEINTTNAFSTKGALAHAYAELMTLMWHGQSPVVSLRNFKAVVGRFAPQFLGYSQHDSQELCNFVLDALTEDLNRVAVQPYVRNYESDGTEPDAQVAQQVLQRHRRRYDSKVADLFEGLFKSQVSCPSCDKVSVTFDPYMSVAVPLGTAGMRVVHATLRRSDGGMHTLALECRRESTVGALLDAAASQRCLNRATLVACEVFGHKLHKFFSAEHPLDRLYDGDCVFIYEVDNAADFDGRAGGSGFDSAREDAAPAVSSIHQATGEPVSEPAVGAAALNGVALPPTVPLVLVQMSPEAHAAGGSQHAGLPMLMAAPVGASGAELHTLVRRHLWRYVVPALGATNGTVPSPMGPGAVGEPVGDAFPPPKVAAAAGGGAGGALSPPAPVGSCAAGEGSGFPTPPLGAGGAAAAGARAGATHTSEMGACGMGGSAMGGLGMGASEIDASGIAACGMGGLGMDTAGTDAAGADACATAASGEAAFGEGMCRGDASGVDMSGVDASGDVVVVNASIVDPSVAESGVDMSSADAACVALSGVDAPIGWRDAPGHVPDASRLPGGAFFGSDGEVHDGGSSMDVSRTSSTDASDGDGCCGNGRRVDWPDRPWELRWSDSTYYVPSSTRDGLGQRVEDDDAPAVGPTPSGRPLYLVLVWSAAAFGRGGGYCRQRLDDETAAATAQPCRKSKTHPGGVTLHDCLDLFAREEVLDADNAWYCPCCKTHRQGRKKLQIWSLPPVLVIHLKRFSNESAGRWRRKVDTLVDFPTRELDLSRHCLSAAPGSAMYDLRAISNHFGGTSSGHYTAFARHSETNAWHEFNDSNVSAADERAVCTAGAYVLIYERRGAQPGGVAAQGPTGLGPAAGEEDMSDAEPDPLAYLM